MNDLDAAQLRLECLKLAQAAKKMVPPPAGTMLHQGYHGLPHEEYRAAEDVVKRALAYTAFIDGGGPAPELHSDGCQYTKTGKCLAEEGRYTPVMCCKRPTSSQDTIIGGAADCQNERVAGDYARKDTPAIGAVAGFAVFDRARRMLDLSPYRSCETEYWWVPAGGFIEGLEWRVVRHEAMPDLPWNPVTGHVEYHDRTLFCRPLQTVSA